MSYIDEQFFIYGITQWRQVGVLEDTQCGELGIWRLRHSSCGCRVKCIPFLFKTVELIEFGAPPGLCPHLQHLLMTLSLLPASCSRTFF